MDKEANPEVEERTNVTEEAAEKKRKTLFIKVFQRTAIHEKDNRMIGCLTPLYLTWLHSVSVPQFNIYVYFYRNVKESLFLSLN